MIKCIFCLTTDVNSFNTKEHILPESLGGGDWALLPQGLFCDACQNKFGSSIEQQALADYPFANVRTFFAIPTKKGKPAWFDSWEGRIISGPKPGILEYQPNDTFLQSTNIEQKTQLILPAITKKPDMVLRTLLKIGLETIAAGEYVDKVFEPRFDAARQFSLHGTKQYDWLYLLIDDVSKINSYLKGNMSDEATFSMNICEPNKEQEYLHLKILYLDILVPLIEHVIIDPEVITSLPHKSEIIIV